MRIEHRLRGRHVLLGSLAIAVLLSGALLIAADDTPASASHAAADQNVGQKKRRLPQFYAQVISPDQREKIYKIQDDYAPRIAELEEKLAALHDECDTQIRAILSPEQQKRVDELAAAAAKQKPQKAKAKAKSGD